MSRVDHADRAAVARAGLETLEQRRLLSVTVDFEAAPIGQLDDVPYEEAGYQFEELRSYGSDLEASVIYGSGQGYESKVLHTFDWGNQIRVSRSDGESFDIERFDYAAGRWGEAMDFRAVGVFEDGTTQTMTAGSDSKSLSTLDLDWTGLTSLSIKFAGGANDAFGAVDNFVFGDGDDNDGEANQSAGTLVSGFGEEGVTQFDFDEKVIQAAVEAVVADDGSIYVLGYSVEPGYGDPLVEERLPAKRRGEDLRTAGYSIARLTATGELDYSYFGDGIATVEELGWNPELIRISELRAADDGGYFGFAAYPVPITSTWRFTRGTIFKLNADMSFDTSFGSNGLIILPQSEYRETRDFTPLPGGGVALLADYSDAGDRRPERLYTYNADGQMTGSQEIEPLLGTSQVRPFSPIAADGNGRIYVGFGGYPSQEVDDPFDGVVAIARFNPDLTLDESYGTSGVAVGSNYSDLTNTRIDQLIVNDAGRAVAVLERLFPNDIFVESFDSSGNHLFQASDLLSGAEVFGEWKPSDALVLPTGEAVLAFADIPDVPAVLEGNISVGASIDPEFTALLAVRLTADGRVDPTLQEGVVTIYDETQPITTLDAAFLPNGDLLIAGSVESFDIADKMVVEDTYDRDASVRLLDMSGPGNTRTFNLEEFAGQTVESGVVSTQGYSLTSKPSTGPFTADPLVFLGERRYPAPSYTSTTVQPQNWGRMLVLERDDGAAFDLDSLDAGAGRYSEDADFTITGHFADGTTAEREVTVEIGTFMETVDLDWTGLQRVEIDFSGGMDNGFAAIDNFVTRPSAGGDDGNHEETIDFAGVPNGPIGPILETDEGLTFINVGPGSEPLYVSGSGTGFATNVLSTQGWGRSIDIVRTGGGTFDLHRFDYASNRWGDTGDFVLTGYFSDGSTQSLERTFSSKSLTTLDLGWEDLDRVEIDFAGGANDANGSIDNVVFAT